MESEKLRVTIMFSDIQGSTVAAYRLGMETYNTMLREYQQIAFDTLAEYKKRYMEEGKSKSQIEAKAVGDECCAIIWGGDPGEDALHALRIGIYLKESWKKGESVTRIRNAAQTGLYPAVDLRVGISSGLVMRQFDPWAERPTFEGVAFNEAKRIESIAGSSSSSSTSTTPDPLIMVSQDVKYTFESVEKGIEFGPPLRLSDVAKGVPEEINIYVFPVLSYQEWARLQAEAVEEEPVSAWDLMDRALALQHSGQLDEAITLYKRAVALDPNLHEAWKNMGIAHHQKGEQDEAIRCYKRALEIKPGYHYAWSNMGVAYAYKGEYDEAIRRFQQALEIKPDFHEALDNIGYAYTKKGQYDQALIYHRKALDLRPDFADAYYNIACAYTLKGELEMAVAPLAKAIDLDPKNRDDAKTDPDFDPIRDQPEFRRLVYGET